MFCLIDKWPRNSAESFKLILHHTLPFPCFDVLMFNFLKHSLFPGLNHVF